MADTFDPYYKWLGVRSKERPPNYYHLVGVELFESDKELMDDSAERQMTYVRTFQTGKRSELSQRILKELTVARSCLLDDKKRAAYDSELRQSMSAAGDRVDESVTKHAPSGGSRSSEATPESRRRSESLKKPKTKSSRAGAPASTPQRQGAPSVPMSGPQPGGPQPGERPSRAAIEKDPTDSPSGERTIAGVPRATALLVAGVCGCGLIAGVAATLFWLWGRAEDEVAAAPPVPEVVAEIEPEAAQVANHDPPANASPFSMTIVRREPESPVAGGELQVWVEADTAAHAVRLRFPELDESWMTSQEFLRARPEVDPPSEDEKGAAKKGFSRSFGGRSEVAAAADAKTAPPTFRQAGLAAGALTLEVQAVDAKGRVLGELKESVAVEPNPLSTWKQTAALLLTPPIHLVTRSPDRTRLAVVCRPPSPELCGQVTVWDKTPALLSVQSIPDLYVAAVRNDGVVVGVARRSTPGAKPSAAAEQPGSLSLDAESARESRAKTETSYTLRLWQDQRSMIPLSPAPTLTAAAFSENGAVIAAAGQPAIQVWDLRGKLLGSLNAPPGKGPPSSVAPAMALNGKYMAATHPLSIWDLSQRRLIAAPEIEAACVAFNHDATRLVTGSPGAIQIWDAAAGALHMSIAMPTATPQGGGARPSKLGGFSGGFAGSASSSLLVSAVAFSLRGDRVAAAAAGVIYIWRIEDAQLLGRFQGHTGDVTSLCFLDSGLVSAGSDRSVRFWGPAVDGQEHTLRKAPAPVSRLPVEVDDLIAHKQFGKALTMMEVFPAVPAPQVEESSDYSDGLLSDLGGSSRDSSPRVTYELLMAEGKHKQAYEQLLALNVARLPLPWTRPKVSTIRTAYVKDLGGGAEAALKQARGMPAGDQAKKELAEFLVYRDYPKELLADDQWFDAQETKHRLRRNRAKKLLKDATEQLNKKKKENAKRIVNRLLKDAIYFPDLAAQARRLMGGGSYEGIEDYLDGYLGDGGEGSGGRRARRASPK